MHFNEWDDEGTAHSRETMNEFVNRTRFKTREPGNEKEEGTERVWLPAAYVGVGMRSSNFINYFQM